MSVHTAENDVLEKVRVLAESEGMIARCDTHGHGPSAVIEAGCDWCAAYGVDQDWRDALLAILGGRSHPIPPGEPRP